MVALKRKWFFLNSLQNTNFEGNDYRPHINKFKKLIFYSKYLQSTVEVERGQSIDSAEM